jgi:N-acetylglutamate synthase-like GNAT family acetyltransferase
LVIRDAAPADLEAIRALLTSLKLPVDGVAEHLGRFMVLELDGRFAGTAGLEVYGERGLLRSLAVAPSRQGVGFGQYLYEAVVDRARELGVRELFLLTETAERFFRHNGFAVVPRAAAGPELNGSVEFRAACPASAVCMRLRLS